MRKCISLLVALIFYIPALQAESDYQLGRGLQLGDAVTIGGYISAEYGNGDREDEFKIDDLAVLIYGSVSDNLSYLVELESVDFYVADFLNDTTKSNVPPAIERLYVDYKFSDFLSVRAGKQITPIGYWNLQPINVLRETTSNPRFSRATFPKFLTGLDFYGYAPLGDDLTYHIYLQGTGDLDDAYININIDQHYGFSVEKILPGGFQFGMAAGRYRETDRTTDRYIEANARWQSGKVKLFSEGIITTRDVSGPNDRIASIYLQGEYHFSGKHAAISRVEYFHDDRETGPERIGVLGYSYRPLFPVSLKFEYQWHSDSRDDKFLTSFSVLF